ncbi:FecR family protein [Tunicatimonas pelagia]|uniref:FecR family protein n=1 Tax=Tunicatimonas pelagia TaxID=931531 RepID=UPI002665849D|nr:FecR domain-containing protein [Tunicatimonas pelagia]WKN44884.1 FecR domain-containing protein [Tunicatimonas pelagia]
MQSSINPEDFASDASFQRWVLTNDSEAHQKWEHWLVRHPDQKSIVEEARQLVLALHFSKDTPRAGSKLEVWQRIQAENKQVAQESAPVRQLVPRYLPWKIAAAVSLLLAATLSFWILRTLDYEVYTTGYGETREIALPDGSQVALNANSTLRYPTDWDERTHRQVSLEGEAYFTVTKQKNVSDTSSFTKFIVHTDDLAIEVLGTAFNVNTRRRATQVVLEHGKVKIIPEADTAKALFMHPGELVEYYPEVQSVLRKTTDTPVFTSWKEGELIFHDQTLREIADRLEDTYGYQIIFNDQTIGQKKFTVSIPTEDVELLFPMLARSFSLHLKRADRQIIYSRQ